MNLVLIVADEAGTRRRTRAALRDGGFEVVTACSLRQAGPLVRRRPLVAVVIDPPDEGRVDAIEGIRARTDVPLLVMSEREEHWAKVELLDAGADDYLTKPCDPEELCARLRAVLRRTTTPTLQAPVVTDDFTVYLGDRRFVLADGSEAPLSPTEWRLVETLIVHPGRLVTQREILRTVWGAEAEEKTHYLRVYMAKIRRKVEPDPSRPRYFLTVAGLGLRFVTSTPSHECRRTAQESDRRLSHDVVGNTVTPSL